MPAPSSARLTVDTTKTFSSTSSKTAAAAKGPRIRTTDNVVQLAASQWVAMDGQQRDSYAALAKQIANVTQPTLSTRKGAYGVFVQIAAANIATGQNIPTTAPPYIVPPALPAMQVIATYENNRFRLMLVPSTPYPHPIALKACCPILASTDVYKSAAFKKIGFIPSLTGPLDITALYQTRYRVPGLGYKIALEVMGVTPGGYHTPALFAFGVISNTAATASLADPNTAQDNAAPTLLQAA